MTIRIIAGMVVGGIVMFVLGFLIYGMALESFMKANMVEYTGLIKDPPNFGFLIIANLAFGLLLAFIAEYWARVRTFAGGAKLGLIVSFIVAVWINSMFLAFMNLYTGNIANLVDILVSSAMGAIAGGCIGFVLGKMDKAESA